MFLLREYIKSLLEARKSKESAEERLQHEIDTLKKYLDKGYFFHMTDDYSLQGVNINTDYSTPLGIYFFPLTQEFYEMILDGSLPFAEDRQYILIYSIVSGDIVRSSVYDWTDFRNDYEILTNETLQKRQNGGLILPEDWNIRVDHPMSALLYLVYEGEFKGKNSALKATKNLLKLGYVGLYDDAGLGIIHENEPTQAVIFSSKYCKLIEAIRNPFAIKKLRKDNYTKQLSKTFMKMSEDEQINVIKELDELHLMRLLTNLVGYPQVKLTLPPKVQMELWKINPAIIKFLENYSNDILERISQYNITHIFYSNEPISNQVLQYMLDNHKFKKLAMIKPDKMSSAFRNKMLEIATWDDYHWKWIYNNSEFN